MTEQQTNDVTQPERTAPQPTLWNPIEPWPEPVGSEIFSDIEEQVLKTHAHLQDEDDAFFLPFWVAFANMVDAMEYSPRLYITAPFRSSGKTELLKLLQLLTNNHVKQRVLTEAMFTRLHRDGTPLGFFLDEGERVFKYEDSTFTTALHIGHEVGAPMGRCDNNLNLVSYPLVSAIAIAGIDLVGTFSDTTLSRGITVHMLKAKKGQIKEKFRKRKHLPKIEELARKLLRWCNDNKEACRDYEPDFKDRIEDRDESNWYHLVAIASVASPALGERMMRIAIAKSAASEELEDDLLMRLVKDSESVYSHVRHSLAESNDDGMSSKCFQVTAMARELANSAWSDEEEVFWSRYNSNRNSSWWKDEDFAIKPNQLTKLYKKLGLIQTGKTKKSFKLEHGEVMNGISWIDLHDIYDRYAGTSPVIDASNEPYVPGEDRDEMSTRVLSYREEVANDIPF